MPRKIFVTSALPNANGPIHLGHMLEHIQTDIWVRFQRMRGHEVVYACADDTHGTATMLKAEEENTTPEELIERVRLEHQSDFENFLVSHDNYYSTHSQENQYYSELIYTKLKEKGLIIKRDVEQLFDKNKGLFLADRFIKGTCPKCHAEDQYGDNCQVCGATYNATELLDPRSVYSGEPPELKKSEHLFFDLAQFDGFLKDWLSQNPVRNEVANKLQEWLKDGLRPWDISRDAPYFGFQIPGENEKFFYVWMDAPIGYLASLKNWCDTSNISNIEDYWAHDSSTEVHHFIGKDIINFHALFWPAVLEGSGFRKPTKVHVHGFLTVNGVKMSKSRGTFITAKTYSELLEPEYLRYYLAAKLNGSVDDVDFNLEDFVLRTNSDLVGKVINIASRCSGFIEKNFENTLSDSIDDQVLLDDLLAQTETIASYYEQNDTSKAVREIMSLADLCNQYIAEKEPWKIIKEPNRADEVQQVCSLGINLFRILMAYLKPILPELASKTEAFLNCEPLDWSSINQPLLKHKVNKFKPMLQRLETKTVEKLIAKPKPQQDQDNKMSASDAEIERHIDINDFAKVQMKVAQIVSAEHVEGADKLLKLQMDIGEETNKTVFSGIKSAYSPDELTGKLTVMVTNLQPRKMKFGTSEGMILAAGEGEKDIFLLSVDSGATPGMDIT
ncbi:MAG: methionine--tRNA ligase [Candidatus Azotimanducaceae bacterium]